MSCYRNGDLVTYRIKGRVYTATVRGDHPEIADTILVWGRVLGGDRVPTESILMHQPTLGTGPAWGEGESIPELTTVITSQGTPIPVQREDSDAA